MSNILFKVSQVRRLSGAANRARAALHSLKGRVLTAPGTRPRMAGGSLSFAPRGIEARRNIVITSATPADDEDLLASAAVVDELVKEVFQELFVSTSARYLLEEAINSDSMDEKNELSEIMAKVVGPRLDDMPSSVIPMIDAYLASLINEDGATSNDDICKVLLMIKEHIVKEMEAMMPESVKMLQQIVDASDREARAVIFSQRNAENNRELLQSCEKLINQLEDDMDIKVDKRLLYKLVVIRSELSGLVLDHSEASMRNRFVQIDSIPETDLEMIEKLMGSSSIDNAVEEYLLGEARPGRLLDSMMALQSKLDAGNRDVIIRTRQAVVEACDRLSSLSNDEDTFLP
jgi:hypothetical protein